MVHDRRLCMVDLTAPHQFQFPFPLYYWMKELPPGGESIVDNRLPRSVGPEVSVPSSKRHTAPTAPSVRGRASRRDDSKR